MAKTNIYFNDANYSIDESLLTSASTDLKSHLSTVMNGTGAVINLGGTSYNVDSAKLSAIASDFIAHLGTIAGNGLKLTINGVEYSVDSTKLSSTIAGLETVLSNLENSTSNIPTYNGYLPLGTYTIDLDRGTELVSFGLFDEDESGFIRIPENGKPHAWLDLAVDPEYESGVFMDYGCYEGCDECTYWETGAHTFEIIKEIAVSEKDFYAFMFDCGLIKEMPDIPDTPDKPVYNGYMQLGKYTINTHASTEEYSFMFELGDWFIAYDGETPRSCFGLDGGAGFFEAYYGDYDCFEIDDGATIEVTRDVEVSEDNFNLFVTYFTPQ